MSSTASRQLGQATIRQLDAFQAVVPIQRIHRALAKLRHQGTDDKRLGPLVLGEEQHGLIAKPLLDDLDDSDDACL
ncbi:MAG: hypothetical protein IPF83_13245 [Rhodanobacteraceae bacterium]|nr:hypothetical protein [Rhodanobacteraceae bacterium]